MGWALKLAEHRQLAPKQWLAATAKEASGSDMRSKELSVDRLKPRNAFQLADTPLGELVRLSSFGRASKDALRPMKRFQVAPEAGWPQ